MARFSPKRKEKENSSSGGVGIYTRVQRARIDGKLSSEIRSRSRSRRRQSCSLRNWLSRARARERKRERERGESAICQFRVTNDPLAERERESKRIRARLKLAPSRSSAESAIRLTPPRVVDSFFFFFLFLFGGS